MSFDLSEVLNWIGIEAKNLDIKIEGIATDSRKIKPGDLFIALNGTQNHGMDFSYQVQRIGAKAILAETLKDKMAKPKSRREPLKIPVIEIENLGQMVGKIASNFYQNPSHDLKITGITGTNGKTSCAWLLAQSWAKLGIKSGYIGTLGYGTVQRLKKLKNTTPPSLKIQKILKKFVKKGITHVAMEVSSHGLDQGRCNAIKFQGAGFTNLSQDHLDYHKTIEHYAQTKRKLFEDFDTEFQILNADDPVGRKWLQDSIKATIEASKNTASSFSHKSTDADYFANNCILHPEGLGFELIHNKKSYTVKSELLGQFNVENLLLVIATLHRQGFKLSEICKTIQYLKPVMGRMNTVQSDSNHATVVIDYAHTPDALEQVLMALKQHNPEKIWCVFGCGGNRDKGKRPQMGHIAESYADHVILTDDNPRFESSELIINDILLGMKTEPKIIQDRLKAIEYAILNSNKDDLVLIAGKGHETYQEIQGEFHTFDDTRAALEILESNND